MAWGEAELEPEVVDWLESLDDQRWAQALFHLDLLEERGALLGEPYTRQLSGKLRELRFYCGGERIRITYWTRKPIRRQGFWLNATPAAIKTCHWSSVPMGAY